ncbi:MAG: dTMP kinase [Synechococcales cyanobacterium T60_A2020_003]|nr:dTMP kinase [Synechococcales cyanobacterium T60_A2020_003]
MIPSRVDSLLNTPERRRTPGTFIVLEGGEGSGKTTQIKRLDCWLAAHPWFQILQAHYPHAEILTTREPGGTPIGQAIRKVLLDQNSDEVMQDRAELLLYAADRAQHVESYLRPALIQGSIVLCDRYTDSTVAYQGYGRGLDLGLIEQLNAIATGGLQSDLTLWLDVDVEIGLQRTKQRGSLDRLEQASLDFHQRVRAGFQVLAHQYPKRIVRIDASLEPDQVAQQVQTVVMEHLQQWYPSFSNP